MTDTLSPGGALTPADVTFALASCQYPGGLLDRTPSHLTSSVAPSARSMERLLASRVDLAIFTGDLIYTDATAGLFDPTVLDGYDKASCALVQETAFTNILSRTTVCTMLDDHEISDNWEPEPASARPPLAATMAYVRWLRQAGPGRIDYRSYADGDPLWYECQLAGHRFFFADTRTTREPRCARNLRTTRIMNDTQWIRLEQWIKSLSKTERMPAFIVSPAMLLPRRLATARQPMAALHSDAWDGYPASLHAILALAYRENVNQLVFLSGDEHLSCVARIVLWHRDSPAHRVVVHSIHSSALYAPYPFANGVAENFARIERFAFDDPGVTTGTPYCCSVRTWFPTLGDGFALVTTRKTPSGRWELEVDFDREPAPPDRRSRCRTYAL